MAMRLANTFNGPRTIFCRCSMVRSIPPCTACRKEDGSKWEMAPDRNREFKYYRLTDKGRKQLVVEESQWKQMAEAVAHHVARPRGKLKCDDGRPRTIFLWAEWVGTRDPGENEI